MKRLLSITLCIIFIVSSFAGCSSNEATTPKVRIAGIINSPTAFLSNMLEKSEGDNQYQPTIVNLPSRVKQLLADGECDIAVVPVDTACNLFNKPNPEIKVIAGISVGGFELISSKKITSLEELKGATIHLTQRDTLMANLFEYLLKRYKLVLNKDYKFSYANDFIQLKDSFNEKEAEFALLPSAEAALLRTEISGLTSYNITEELAKKFKKPSIITYCVIGTSTFIEKNPKVIDTLLKDVKASIIKTKQASGTTVQLAKKHNILTDDNYNEDFLFELKPSFISGSSMRKKLNAYFKFIDKFKPTLVNKIINNKDFYYISKNDSKSTSKSNSASSSTTPSSVAAKTQK